MAEKHGKTGGVYAASAIRRATTIAFVNGTATITDSANGFVTAGFVQGMKIVVIGSTSNNATYTIATGGVAAGTLTLTGTPPLVDEAAGDLVTIYQAPAGTAIAGFYNWTFDEKCETSDITDFDSGGNREYLAGDVAWSGQGERNWQNTDDKWACDDSVGTYQWIRFFTKYVASPAVGDPAHFFEGLAIVTASNPDVKNTDAIRQTFTFQGTGALTETIQTSSW